MISAKKLAKPLALALLIASPRPGSSGELGLELEPVIGALSVAVSINTMGDDRLFVAQQGGLIRILRNDQFLPTPFLDITALTGDGLEGGIKSIAFHPMYNTNGFFFVHYSDQSDNSVLARYTVSADPDVADAGSGVSLLTIPQFTPQHRGGQLAFGPDGYLYASLGDGGGQQDPECRAQDPATLHGKVLRLDVNQSIDAPPFHGIPGDNPFVGAGSPLDEIWAIGFRNPWRFSFDRLTGDLFLSDVGQDSREEVSFQPADSSGGENYGWKVMEGTFCHDPDPIDPDCPAETPPCFDDAYTDPILEIVHGSGDCSITGGYVYRGSQIPGLAGSYLYGDWCTGRIWGATSIGGSWTAELLDISLPGIVSFAEDRDGELLLTDGTTLYRLVGPTLFTDGFESSDTSSWTTTVE